MPEEKTSTITLPATIAANGSGENIAMIPANWDDMQGFTEYLLGYAASVILQRASAGKADDEEKATKAVAAAVERLMNGVVPAGGGFTKLTPEEYAMKETLAVNKVKFAKNETVDACLLRCATALTAEVDGESGEERTQSVSDTLATLTAELKGSEVYKTALKARLSKTKTATTQSAMLAGLK